MRKPMTWRPAAIGATFALLGAALVPGAATAAEGDIASVGDDVYATLADAVAAAETGDTITLKADTTLDSAVHFDGGRTLTLDLDGHTVTTTGGQNGEQLVIQDVHLTIEGAGAIKGLNKDADVPLRIRGGVAEEANFTVVNLEDGVTVEGLAGAFISHHTVDSEPSNNGVVVNLNGAALDGYYYALFINGSITPDNTPITPIINVTGSTLKSADGLGMYLAGTATTTVTGSQIEALTGIELRAGTLSVIDTDIEAGTGALSVAPNLSGATSKNVAIAVTQHATIDPTSLTVSGGNYSGTAAIYLGNPQENPALSDDVAVDIRGGNFVGRVISTNNVGAPLNGFITGGSFEPEPFDPEFLESGQVFLAGAGVGAVGGTFHVMSSEQARARAEASMKLGEYTFFFERAADVQALLDGSDEELDQLELTLIHTVTFDYNNGEGSTVVKVDDGDKVSKPANPTRAGYVFKGWDYNFSTAVTGNITVKAQWEVESAGPAPVPNPVNLVDVSSNKNSKHYTQFHREINWLANSGITKGWAVGGGKHEFRPHDAITREAMAAFMYRAAGSPAVDLPATSPFADVTPQNTWFYKEIVWMSQQNISNGWVMPSGKNEFRPKDNITRDAMAAFMYRFAGKPAFTAPATSPFADTSKSRTQFYTEISWLQTQNVSNGWAMPSGKNEYRPYDQISRAAMAAFLYRYYERVV